MKTIQVKELNMTLQVPSTNGACLVVEAAARVLEKASNFRAVYGPGHLVDELVAGRVIDQNLSNIIMNSGLNFVKDFNTGLFMKNRELFSTWAIQLTDELFKIPPMDQLTLSEERRLTELVFAHLGALNRGVWTTMLIGKLIDIVKKSKDEFPVEVLDRRYTWDDLRAATRSNEFVDTLNRLGGMGKMIKESIAEDLPSSSHSCQPMEVFIPLLKRVFERTLKEETKNTGVEKPVQSTLVQNLKAAYKAYKSNFENQTQRIVDRVSRDVSESLAEQSNDVRVDLEKGTISVEGTINLDHPEDGPSYPKLSPGLLDVAVRRLTSPGVACSLTQISTVDQLGIRYEITLKVDETAIEE